MFPRAWLIFPSPSLLFSLVFLLVHEYIVIKRSNSMNISRIIIWSLYPAILLPFLEGTYIICAFILLYMYACSMQFYFVWLLFWGVFFLLYETIQIILLTFFSLTICPYVLFFPIQINLSHSFNYCIIIWHGYTVYNYLLFCWGFSSCCHNFPVTMMPLAPLYFPLVRMSLE